MENNFAEGDRRKFQRLRLYLSLLLRVDDPWYVRFKFQDRQIEATALNISEGGMAILIKEDLPVGCFLNLKFSLYKVNKEGEVCFSDPLEISAEVRSKSFYGDQYYRLGVSFLRHEDRINNRIGTFVRLAG